MRDVRTTLRSVRWWLRRRPMVALGGGLIVVILALVTLAPGSERSSRRVVKGAPKINPVASQKIITNDWGKIATTIDAKHRATQLLPSNTGRKADAGVDSAYKPGSCPYADAVVKDHPVGYWRFSTSKKTGSLMPATVGHQHAVAPEGILFGMPSAVHCLADYSAGFLWKRHKMIKIPFYRSLAAHQYTIELWARPTGIGLDKSKPKTFQTVFSSLNKQAGLTTGAAIVVQEQDMLGVWGVTCGEGRNLGVTSGSRARIGEWHHLAATFDGTAQRLYVDGKLKSFSAAKCKPSFGTPVLIGGASSGGPYFQGDIDEVAIYSRPLKESDVARHYRAAHAGASDDDESGSGSEGSASGSEGSGQDGDEGHGNDGDHGDVDGHDGDNDHPGHDGDDSEDHGVEGHDDEGHDPGSDEVDDDQDEDISVGQFAFSSHSKRG